MSQLSVSKATGPLRGTVTVPGDKSMTHRGLLVGALGNGPTRIQGYSRGEDCLNTLRALRGLGVEIRESPGAIEVVGQGLCGLREPNNVIDCGNSGTGIRLLMGVLAGQNFFSVLTGDASLRGRPMGRVVSPLRMMGAMVTGRGGGEMAPLAIQGKRLKPCAYDSPVASAQVKSCILFAGLFAEGQTTITEPLKSRDHTERLFQYVGLPLEVEGNKVAVRGGQSFEGTSLKIPGDISAAAFFMVAGSIVPDSEIVLLDVGLNPERTGILDLLIKMGGDITVMNEREESGEPVGDIRVKTSELHSIHIRQQDIPKTIDELPILCVAAAMAKGETRISGAQELRVKETDRIHAMATELKKLGVEIQEEPDGLIIQGGRPLLGNRCESFGDHRVVMSLAIAGLVAEGNTVIDDVECVETSFPGFQSKLLDLLTNSA